MADAYRLSAPGLEKSVEVGLRVPSGDTVTVGNITVTRSTTVFQVQNLVVNTTPIVMDGMIYGPGQGVRFDLNVPNAVPNQAAYVDFAYTTQGGVKRTDRVHLLILDAVSVEVTSEISGASYIGRSTTTDNLLQVLGVAPTDTHLGDMGGMPIPANSSVRNALVSLGQQWGPTINVEQYGVVYGAGVSKAQAEANADALAAAYSAAFALGVNLPAGGWGGSINRWLPPRLVISGQVVIAKPWVINKQAPCVFLDGTAGSICCYNTATFETDWPGRWGIEIGGNGNLNQGPMFMGVQGLTVTGFRRCVSLGFPPANVNFGQVHWTECHFVGPVSGHPDTWGVRIFDRSTNVTFNRCGFNGMLYSLDIQSSDVVTLTDCRWQLSNEVMSSRITRPQTAGHIILRHGRLVLRTPILNPPLITHPLWSGPGAAYIVGEYVRVPSLGNAVRRCITAHTSTGSYDASKFETPPTWTQSLPNMDTQRFAWVHVTDFPAFEANKVYIPGDVILQPYDGVGGTGNAVYWSRLAYGTGRASWDAAERANWQVIDSMRDFLAGEVVANNTVRRCYDSVSGLWKFYVRPTGGTCGASFDATEAANWTAIGNTGASFDAYGTGTFTAYREAGQPISVWHWLDFEQQGICGAESGGMTPVIWDVPPMPLYAAGVENRKLQTCLRFVGNSANTIAAYPLVDQSVNLAPIVLLRQIPNQLIIEDNHVSGPTLAVACMYDPLLAARPYLRVPNSSNYFSTQEVSIRGNYCGRAGISAFDATSYPHANSYRYYGPNWAPHELLYPLLTQTLTADDPTLVTDWAINTAVRVGELRAITIATVEKIYRSRETRMTRAQWDATEAQHWQLVDDLQVSASTYHSPTVGRSNVVRSFNPTAWIVNSFDKLEPGRVLTVYHENANATYQHVVGRMRLKGAANVTPAFGTVMQFTVVNGEVWEVGRSF